MDALINKTLTSHKSETTLLWDCDCSGVASALMQKAKENIYTTTYKMEPKGIPKAKNVNRMISQLVAANYRGVNVKILMNFQQNKKATSSVNWYAASALAKRNLKSKYLTSGRILHAKIIIIDFDFVIIGSHNWSVLSHCRNIEFSILIKSEVVNKEMREKFLNMWDNSTEFPARKV